VRRDDTIAVLDAIGADRVHLVGYSLGGRNAFYVATYQPERVASVVVAGANPFPTPLNMELTERLRRTSRRPKHIRALLRLRRMLARRISGRPTAELIDAAGGEPFDVSEAIEAMTMPVYLITGEFDERFAVELTKSFADQLPDARFEIVPGETHGMLPRMQSMLPKIEEFLLGVSAPA
jgi:pimeloyl-ACP methyl ester carboxylesterase